ncbi:hypothetical protein V1511DRAFT_280 [Dipodascopsis uninucleata]
MSSVSLPLTTELLESRVTPLRLSSERTASSFIVEQVNSRKQDKENREKKKESKAKEKRRGARTLRYFKRLHQAQQAVWDNKAFGNERVWAIDKRRYESDGENIYVGKMFMVGTESAVFDMMAARVLPCNVYEIIRPGYCRLYLDIKMSVNDDTILTNDICCMLFKLIRLTVRTYIKMAFPKLEKSVIEGDTLLQACAVGERAGKFSVHYLHPLVVFSEVSCSMLTFAFELDLYMRQSCKDHAMHADTPDFMRPVLEKAATVGIIDLGVYNKNQQLRSIGKTKLDAQRPLTIVNE